MNKIEVPTLEQAYALAAVAGARMSLSRSEPAKMDVIGEVAEWSKALAC